MSTDFKNCWLVHVKEQEKSTKIRRKSNDFDDSTFQTTNALKVYPKQGSNQLFWLPYFKKSVIFEDWILIRLQHTLTKYSLYKKIFCKNISQWKTCMPYLDLRIKITFLSLENFNLEGVHIYHFCIFKF